MALPFFCRSHAIFTVWLKVVYTDPQGLPHIKKGKLNLVDLAGSERHGKTGIYTTKICFPPTHFYLKLDCFRN